MPEIPQGVDVYARAKDRIRSLYLGGHRVVVAFSGGKDSTIILNLCVEVATELDLLPVEASFFDEEIIYPGVVDYLLRVGQRDDIDFNWFSARCPQINAFSRDQPYWWTFDDRLNPSEWIRQPPDQVVWIDDNELKGTISPRRFPPPPGKSLVSVQGIRATESRNRRMSIFSSRGFLSKENKYGHKSARPIFDWKDSDVWKAISDHKWDYAQTYNLMLRLGISKSRMRIGPPTMTSAAVSKLQMAAKAWPQWFDKLTKRLPGIRTAAMFGKRAIQPNRRLGETWSTCYQRTCIDEAPEWLATRCAAYKELRERQHRYHSNEPLPEAAACATCYANGSWKAMTKAMYMGDPFAIKDGSLRLVEPDEFRPGSGKWWISLKQREKDDQARAFGVS